MLIIVNTLTAMVVAASFVMLFGFDEPLLPKTLLYSVQAAALCIFIGEKVIRFYNTFSAKEYFRYFWYHIPFLAALAAAIFGAGRWFGKTDPMAMRHAVIGGVSCFAGSDQGVQDNCESGSFRAKSDAYLDPEFSGADRERSGVVSSAKGLDKRRYKFCGQLIYRYQCNVCYRAYRQEYR